jgi:hypothetical protein
MRFPGNVVTRSDTRADGAGTPDKCFYCAGKFGDGHDSDCVCLDRPVKIRLTLDLIVNRPRSWSKEEIEFHSNQGSWCINNIVADIERHASKGRCLCSIGTLEYLADATLEEATAVGMIPDSEQDETPDKED